MLITTFNVNSVRARLPVLTKWLDECRPDFLFMQETKTQDKDFPELAFSELGYRAFYHGEKSYNGVAVLVKDNLGDVSVEFGFNDNYYSEEDSEENRFTTRVLTLRHGQLVVLNTYVPQGKAITSPDYDVKKKFLARVKAFIAHNSNKLFLWLGDLNVAPDLIDVTHPENKKNHVCFCDEIRDIFADTSSGLVDLLRLFNKNPGVFTFFDYRVRDSLGKNIGWRIDHMLASESLAKLAKHCEPDTRVRGWGKPSDHVPLSAEFEQFLP
ncbi:MAG: exodeoxyribonuclease III [Synergistaceae bacterium]|nr:exodeoxyribonuclease III [Synergistaceae bacterium]